MKNNETTLIFSNHEKFLEKRKELIACGRKPEWKTKRCAVTFADKVLDCDEPGFTMGKEKRPINFYPRLYYITYKGIRILPHDTK